MDSRELTDMKKISQQIIILFVLFGLYNLQAQEDNLSTAALELTKDKVVYDPSYFSIDYPNGDVPKGKGVLLMLL